MLQRRPVVLALGFQAVIKLQRGGARVRLEPARPARDAHQRVRLFGTGGKNAARAVIFERAARQMFAIGQKGGGQRVAFKAGIGLAVEGEANGLGLVDAAFVLNAHVSHHFVSAAGVCSSTGRGLPAL